MQLVYIGNTLINDIMLGAQRMDDAFTKLRGVDNDVQNFINATGITDNNTIAALDGLVTNLKSDGLWDKLYVLYPFVGGTASSSKYNLVNTGSFTITFNGSWTYNNNGIVGDGSTTYANTTFSSGSTNWYLSGSLFNYSRTSGSSQYDMGVNDGAREYYLINRYTNNLIYLNFGTGPNTLSNTTGSGFFMGVSSGSRQLVYKNGSQIINDPTAATFNPVMPFYLGANNFKNTGANSFTNRNYALAGFGKEFSSAQASTFYTIVQNFQTTLGRQV